MANPRRAPGPKGNHQPETPQADLAMLGLLHSEVDDLDRVADEVLQSGMASPEQEADVIAAIQAAATTVSTAQGYSHSGRRP